MFTYTILIQDALNHHPSAGPTSNDRESERGSGIVEWLGISALSIGMLVAVFAALEQLGLDLVDSIRLSLGL